MTDEELGRWWAARNGKRPYRTEWDYFGWQTEKWTSNPAHSLPAFLHTHVSGHHAEGEAYTALGASIRRVLAFAEQVRYALPDLNKSTEVTS